MNFLSNLAFNEKGPCFTYQGSICLWAQPMRDNVTITLPALYNLCEDCVMSPLIGLAHTQNDPCLYQEYSTPLMYHTWCQPISFLVYGWGIPLHTWLITVNHLLMLAAGVHAIYIKPLACTATVYCLNIWRVFTIICLKTCNVYLRYACIHTLRVITNIYWVIKA